jgi:NAD(P)-dependent dehydrogenase (short-subunit alcohol dehydrogenase family)
MERDLRARGALELAGRIALVTGASRGVGCAIALELARRGADLILAARSVDSAPRGMQGTLVETAAEVRRQGREAHTIGVDLSDTEALAGFAAQALGWRGRVDVLVNNAAFLSGAAFHSLDEMEAKNWTRQLAVNLTAPMLLAKYLVPSMRDHGGGAIVNVTSEAALIGEYSYPGIAYGPTKAALNRLTALLARDLRPDDIAVFAVDPGYTRTALSAGVAGSVGLDVSDAHDPSVPAEVVADLIEVDIDVSTGRVFRAVEGRSPFLIADASAPVTQGVEFELRPRRP